MHVIFRFKKCSSNLAGACKILPVGCNRACLSNPVCGLPNIFDSLLISFSEPEPESEAVCVACLDKTGQLSLSFIIVFINEEELGLLPFWKFRMPIELQNHGRLHANYFDLTLLPVLKTTSIDMPIKHQTISDNFSLGMRMRLPSVGHICFSVSVFLEKTEGLCGYSQANHTVCLQCDLPINFCQKCCLCTDLL